MPQWRERAAQDAERAQGHMSMSDGIPMRHNPSPSEGMVAPRAASARRDALRRVFSFPDPVNEDAARVVALGVVTLASIAVVTHQHWLLVPLVYGFAARVLTGPTLSPLGQLATRGVVPLLGRPLRPVPGPPKRFAQAVGLIFSSVALVLALVVHAERAADVVLLALVGAASLEAFFGYCLGCRVFEVGMRIGLVPQSACEACARIGNAYPG